jgi:hypothetical protein
MDKKAKYKLVFDSAVEFLNEIVDKQPGLNAQILDQHLNLQSKFDNIQDAHLRLIESLSNRNMMASVIGFSGKEKEMREILSDYDPNKILAKYKNADELLEVFKIKFSPKNLQSKGNLWRQFAEGIISGSIFMSSFKDKEDFDRFIKTFTHNKYTKAALPMLLSKEIKGYGLALACDFLKELGYRGYPKPDVHLIEIFYALGLSETKEPYEVYKSIIEMAEVVGKDAYTVDKIFWLIGSGNFYLVKIKVVGGNRDKFIETVKGKL